MNKERQYSQSGGAGEGRSVIDIQPSYAHEGEPNQVNQINRVNRVNQVNEARALLKRLIAGEWLQQDFYIEFFIPLSSYRRLYSAINRAQAQGKKGNRIFYNTLTFVLTIMAGPDFINEVTVEWVIDVVRDSTLLDSSMSDILKYYRRRREFSRDDLISEKEPDVWFGYRKSKLELSDIHTIVEIAKSQSYRAVVDVMKFWLVKFPEVNTVVIIDITERPKYHRPTDLTKSQLRRMLPKIKDGQLEYSDLGPVKSEGQQWVGALTFPGKFGSEMTTPESRSSDIHAKLSSPTLIRLMKLTQFLFLIFLLQS